MRTGDRMIDAKKVLEEHGIRVDDLVEIGFSLYVSEDEGDDLAAKRERLRELLEKSLRDQNVALLVAAASHLDGLLRSEDTGGLLSEDPASLVADELIGMSIAEYIAGKRGLFNYVRYDREKPGKIGVLPPFMDDVVSALVAACMTRTFE